MRRLVLTLIVALAALGAAAGPAAAQNVQCPVVSQGTAFQQVCNRADWNAMNYAFTHPIQSNGWVAVGSAGEQSTCFYNSGWTNAYLKARCDMVQYFNNSKWFHFQINIKVGVPHSTLLTYPACDSATRYQLGTWFGTNTTNYISTNPYDGYFCIGTAPIWYTVERYGTIDEYGNY